MLKAKLVDFALRCANALWTMAVLNPRMTGLGVAAAVIFAGTHYGLNFTPSQQRKLAVAIMIFIGLVAGDNHDRRIN